VRRPLTRRTFLALGGTSVLAACKQGVRGPSVSGEPILVVGAGIAGLAAADRLRRAGARPLVLEARNRIGGRIHSHAGFGSAPIELGAELVHGRNAPTWPLVRAAGLTTREVAGVAALEAGRIVPTRNAKTTDDPALVGAIAAALGRRPDAPLAACLAAYPDVLEELGTDLDVDRQSCSAMLKLAQDDERTNGDFLVAGGYARILAPFADGLEIEHSVHATVVRVLDGGVEVIAQDGRPYRGVAAIVTVPLGVLQSGAIRFDPVLPEPIARAVTRLGVADVVKLFYRFAGPALPKGVDMLATVGGTPSRFWSATPGMDGQEQVVVGWVTHGAARRVLQLGEQAALALGLETLGAGRSLPRVLDARWSEWSTDPLARGAYSMTPVGGLGARAALIEPIHGRVFLAGEHTGADGSEQSAFTVHGAMLSGLAAAERALGRVRAR
jgi:monoamine oxidase